MVTVCLCRWYKDGANNLLYEFQQLICLDGKKTNNLVRLAKYDCSQWQLHFQYCKIAMQFLYAFISFTFQG